MERPDLDDYKDEIHHPNGQIEDQWRHGEYVEDLEKYVDYLEKQFALFDVSQAEGEQLVCGHPYNDVYLESGYFHCEKCKGKWKALWFICYTKASW